VLKSVKINGELLRNVSPLKRSLLKENDLIIWETHDDQIKSLKKYKHFKWIGLENFFGTHVISKNQLKEAISFARF
jgi:hypothetical protein